MTDKNRELYKQTFSHLHTDHNLNLEGVRDKMKSGKNMTGLRYTHRLVAVTLAAVLMLAMASITYAATDGAVLDNIKVWIDGKPADAQMTVDQNGECTVKISEGEEVVIESGESSLNVKSGSASGSITVSQSESEDGQGIEESINIESVGE
ncbi:MAG: hypothetical protein ACI4LC_00555 [Emergencia sp.]